MYTIKTQSVFEFITSQNIKLPRFQRKQTWDDKKNFQLCISVFKQYPLGVCILDGGRHGKNFKELLDGRQRRHALFSMYDNPECIYDWAQKFIKFKSNDQLFNIERRFREKINAYMEADDLQDDEFEDENDDLSACSDVVELEDKGPKGLDLLLHIIKAIHSRSEYATGFTECFDFKEFVTKLPYIEPAPTSKKYRLSGRMLKNFIQEYRNFCNVKESKYEFSESFYDFLITRYSVTKQKEKKLKIAVNQNWERILERIEIVSSIENCLRACEIGLIEVTDVKPADSQKIFNIINSEGVKLTAAEILSAKPCWNIAINKPSDELTNVTNEMYKIMGLPGITNVVRWDVPATLLSRIGNNIIYKNLSWDSKNEKNQKSDFEKKLNLGFRTFAGIYERGVKKDDIEKLGNDDSVIWDAIFDQIVDDIKSLIVTIEKFPYFNFLKSWKTSIMELTSDAIAMNFLLVAYFDWDNKKRPQTKGALLTKFHKNCFVMWDKLIYQYVMLKWRGSSDSMIASNINDVCNTKKPGIFDPVDKKDWLTLLTEIFSSSTIEKKNISISIMKPILYHMYCLKNISFADSSYPIEVDHIIPQSLFNGSSIERREIIQHNLFNLGLLSKRENISKSDRTLNQIKESESWLRDEIKRYEFIDVDEYDKFSDVNNYQELFQKRKKVFEEAFTTCRDKLLNN